MYSARVNLRFFEQIVRNFVRGGLVIGPLGDVLLNAPVRVILADHCVDQLRGAFLQQDLLKQRRLLA